MNKRTYTYYLRSTHHKVVEHDERQGERGGKKEVSPVDQRNGYERHHHTTQAVEHADAEVQPEGPHAGADVLHHWKEGQG